jgi:hypothetical protein
VIPRLEAPTREEFERDYVARGRPVILTGVVNRWSAFSSWTVDHFREVAGHHRVVVFVYEDGARLDFRMEEMQLARFLDLITAQNSSRRYYLSDYVLSRRAHGLRQGLPELYEGIPPLAYCDDEDHIVDELFFGKDNVSRLHYHPMAEALMCQVAGAKRITLFSPDQSDLVAPKRWYNPNFHGSNINPQRPDLDRFPRFREARPMSALVEAGEMIYIPIHWWHWTEGQALSMTVARFWKPRLRQVLRPPVPSHLAGILLHKPRVLMHVANVIRGRSFSY